MRTLAPKVQITIYVETTCNHLLKGNIQTQSGSTPKIIRILSQIMENGDLIMDGYIK